MPDETEPEYRFSRMRENAYIASLRDSDELHQAHFEASEPNRALIRVRWLLRVLLAVLYWRVIPFPERPAPPPTAMRTGRPSPEPRLPHVRFDIADRPPARRHLIGGEAR